MDNESVRNIVMLELVAPEDENKRLLPKNEATEVYNRYKNTTSHNWEYTFKPVSDEKWRSKLIDLFNALN